MSCDDPDDPDDPDGPDDPGKPDNPDHLMRAVLPPALEVLTAWSIAEAEADPSVFHAAMDRMIGDASRADEPLRGLAQVMFGMSSLSGILLDELARRAGCTHREVIETIHHRYLAAPP